MPDPHRQSCSPNRPHNTPTSAVTPPSPAIVTLSGARRLPRWALALLTFLYVLPGFIGREPWKEADASAFGLMWAMANGQSAWLDPSFLGLDPQTPGLLPYWCGALFIQLFGGLNPEFVVRIPFALMLIFALSGVWYAVYHLAHLRQAQPVVFAFGGQARRQDYALAMADAAVLAFMACLGLARIGHEAAVDVFQLAFAAALLWGISHAIAQIDRLQAHTPYAALPTFLHRRHLQSLTLGAIGVFGLMLSGQPTIALIFCALATAFLIHSARGGHADSRATTSSLSERTLIRQHTTRHVVGWCVLTAVALVLWVAFALPESYALTAALTPHVGWYRWVKLLVWFTWPAWPLALWGLWRWRAHWRFTHVALPLCLAVSAVVMSALVVNATRQLVLALPAMAVLATFALPTLRRRVTALIDWFALLFFSGSGLIIWIIWLAMQTGFPAQPAANVARLAPGFRMEFSAIATLIAAAVTLLWIGVIRWRTRSLKPAIWKSLVLSASGSVWCWLLLTTLWLPLLNHGLSYGPLARQLSAVLPQDASCVNSLGLSQSQLSALAFHTRAELAPERIDDACTYLLVSSDVASTIENHIDLPKWALEARAWQLNNRSEIIYVYQRLQAP